MQFRYVIAIYAFSRFLRPSAFAQKLRRNKRVANFAVGKGKSGS